MNNVSGIVEGAIAMRVAASSEKVGAGLAVLRALPAPRLEAVGPFVFLDHFGPAAPPPGGVPAHPHAGIEVISYILDGENDHRDSFGNAGTIAAGGAQWITSGRGMLHAEFPRGDARGLMQAVQLWTRQPRALDGAAPKYAAAPASAFPHAAIEGGRLRLLAGAMPDVFAAPGPITLAAPAELIHVTLDPKSSVVLPLKPAYEMAVYVLSGTMTIDGENLSHGELALLRPASSVTAANASASEPLEFLLLGGECAERPLLFQGPFVFGSRDAIQRAQQDYAEGRMGRLDGVPF